MSSGPEAGDEHTWSGGDLRNPHVLWSEVMLEEAAAHTFPRAPARVLAGPTSCEPGERVAAASPLWKSVRSDLCHF